jgi:Restriction endonuclease XhoI
MSSGSQLEVRLKSAIKYFWKTREAQAQKQGSVSGSKDAGARSAVTGGAQMNGFVSLVRDLLCENGLPQSQILCNKRVDLPGWYRPEKRWDLRAAWRFMLLMTLAAGLAACGGGGSGGRITNPGTPSGTYTLTVTGTVSGPTALQHSTSLTLKVN